MNIPALPVFSEFAFWTRLLLTSATIGAEVESVVKMMATAATFTTTFFLIAVVKVEVPPVSEGPISIALPNPRFELRLRKLLFVTRNVEFVEEVEAEDRDIEAKGIRARAGGIKVLESMEKN